MLLAGLHGQHPAAFAVAVHGLAHQPAGHLAQEFLAASQDAEVWAAITHGIAQALAFGHRNIRVVLSRPFQQSQADRVEADDEECAAFMRDPGQGLHFFQATKEIRVLHDDASRVIIKPPL